MKRLYKKDDRVGNYTIISDEVVRKGNSTYYHCMCDCGKITMCSSSNLSRNKQTQCQQCAYTNRVGTRDGFSAYPVYSRLLVTLGADTAHAILSKIDRSKFGDGNFIKIDPREEWSASNLVFVQEGTVKLGAGGIYKQNSIVTAKWNVNQKRLTKSYGTVKYPDAEFLAQQAIDEGLKPHIEINKAIAKLQGL